jgi:GAF domain-containing protein
MRRLQGAIVTFQWSFTILTWAIENEGNDNAKICDHKHMKQVNYTDLRRTIASLTDGEDDVVALMATLACEVHHSDERFDWTGFYRVTAPELLKIGPYQGGHGCLVIPFSRGVCGAAAKTGETQLVPDVDAFPGHIACASSTRSEIVLPVFDKAGALIAVFDIDSDQPDAFTQDDAHHLAAILASVFAR